VLAWLPGVRLRLTPELVIRARKNFADDHIVRWAPFGEDHDPSEVLVPIQFDGRDKASLAGYLEYLRGWLHSYPKALFESSQVPGTVWERVSEFPRLPDTSDIPNPVIDPECVVLMTVTREKSCHTSEVLSG